MRISDWSSDVCSSDLHVIGQRDIGLHRRVARNPALGASQRIAHPAAPEQRIALHRQAVQAQAIERQVEVRFHLVADGVAYVAGRVEDTVVGDDDDAVDEVRSEEHTSELQSLMRISYAVFCLKKKTMT